MIGNLEQIYTDAINSGICPDQWIATTQHLNTNQGKHIIEAAKMASKTLRQSKPRKFTLASNKVAQRVAKELREQLGLTAVVRANTVHYVGPKINAHWVKK